MFSKREYIILNLIATFYFSYMIILLILNKNWGWGSTILLMFIYLYIAVLGYHRVGNFFTTSIIAALAYYLPLTLWTISTVTTYPLNQVSYALFLITLNIFNGILIYLVFRLIIKTEKKHNFFQLLFSTQKKNIKSGVFYFIFFGMIEVLNLNLFPVFSENFQIILFLTLLCISFSLFSVYMMYKIQIQNQQLLNHEMSFSKIEKGVEDSLGFKHDLKNIIASIRYLISNNKIEEAILLIDEVEAFEKTLSFQSYKNIKKIYSTPLKGLFISEIEKMEKLGIQFNIVIDKPISNIGINIIDAIRILSILIDNAIEAASLSSIPKISIKITTRSDSTLEIIIQNTLAENQNNIDLKAIMLPNKSSKGSGRGLGLSNLKKICNRYNNINYSFSVIDGNFRATLYISL